MPNWDIIIYNAGAFICALFVLEFGADKFIDNTAIVARRTGIPQALIGLLTAGAEWEELVVVIASITRNRSSLAVGNIIGSAISNILGAFSLGLLLHSNSQEIIVFDRSSKIYSLILLLLTSFVTLVNTLGTHNSWRIFGGILLAGFVLYVVSVTLAIRRGAATAPELSDSDSESDDESSSDETERDVDEETSLLQTGSEAREEPQHPRLHHRRHNLRYHIAILFLGFLAICLSGYVLSHASVTISEELGISDVLFGVVILSIATTLPEKFIAVLSGARGHAGILVANTVGSNTFLLSLCLGIVLVVTSGDFDAGSVNTAEMGVMLGSTVALTGTVWFGARWSRGIGAVMLIAYVVFLVLEFTVIRKC